MSSKQEISVESREEVSGTSGLERTSGTTSTSTGTVERIGVAPAMSDTGSLDHAHTGVGELNTKPSNK
jgi:hypothetical protein